MRRALQGSRAIGKTSKRNSGEKKKALFERLQEANDKIAMEDFGRLSTQENFSEREPTS